jgi:tetratricopeptide (TPR) repeat protein
MKYGHQRRFAISLALLTALVQPSLTSAPGRAAQNARAASKGDGASLPRGALSTNPASRVGEIEAATEYDRLRAEGNRAVYNLDYQGAKEKFLQMTKLAPDRPAAYVYLANNLWLETLNKSRRLSTSLYSGTSFYIQKSESDSSDRDRDREFDRLINQAVALATAGLRKNPADAETLYYQASALGLRAGYTATVGRSFRRAIGDANKSIQLENKVLKLDPGYYDAYLSIGLYEYVVDSLPFGWRVLARLAGLKGSKARGIQELQSVVQNGKYADDDARVLLIGLYTRERKPELALGILDYLAEKYPQNYLFGIERGRILYQVGRREQAAASFSALLGDAKIAVQATDLINFQWGEALEEVGDYQPALDHHLAVINWPKSEAGLVSLAHLHAGEALDMLGKRSDAVSHYRIVLSRENIFDSHDRADELSKQRYTGKHD